MAILIIIKKVLLLILAKNEFKPRHNVPFICTRFVAGGLRKIFRTVRICLFVYIRLKKKDN